MCPSSVEAFSTWLRGGLRALRVPGLPRCFPEAPAPHCWPGDASCLGSSALLPGVLPDESVGAQERNPLISLTVSWWPLRSQTFPVPTGACRGLPSPAAQLLLWGVCLSIPLLLFFYLFVGVSAFSSSTQLQPAQSSDGHGAACMCCDPEPSMFAVSPFSACWAGLVLFCCVMPRKNIAIAGNSAGGSWNITWLPCSVGDGISVNLLLHSVR